jgi:hypothetical protein
VPLKRWDKVFPDLKEETYLILMTGIKDLF